MNITEMLGEPVNDIAEFGQPNVPTCSTPVLPEQSAAPVPRRHGLWVALAAVGALAIGFGAGAYLTRASVTNPPPAASSTTISDGVPPNIGDLAELFTALHLTGLASPSDLARIYPGGTSDGSANGGLWISRSNAVATRSLGGGFWAVTVAVDALEMVDEVYETAGLQYFEVTIAENAGQPVAMSAPSRVPGPGVAGEPAGSPAFDGAVPADQAAVVASFLEAYLTGRGEVARFVGPTARIPLFTEAPYTSIAVGSMGSDSVGRVNVQIEALTSRGGHHNIEYTLELTIEGGVWELSRLVPVVEDTR